MLINSGTFQKLERALLGKPLCKHTKTCLRHIFDGFLGCILGCKTDTSKPSHVARIVQLKLSIDMNPNLRFNIVREIRSFDGLG